MDPCSPVRVNIYHFPKAVDLRAMGLGVYHSGVEVDGVEYGYGGHDSMETGIWENEPTKAGGFIFKRTVEMGNTHLTRDEVYRALETLYAQWPGCEYDMIRKNCNHFSSAFCTILVNRTIPSWVNRLADVGAGWSNIFGRPGFLGPENALENATKAQNEHGTGQDVLQQGHMEVDLSLEGSEEWVPMFATVTLSGDVVIYSGLDEAGPIYTYFEGNAADVLLKWNNEDRCQFSLQFTSRGDPIRCRTSSVDQAWAWCDAICPSMPDPDWLSNFSPPGLTPNPDARVRAKSLFTLPEMRKSPSGFVDYGLGRHDFRQLGGELDLDLGLENEEGEAPIPPVANLGQTAARPVTAAEPRLLQVLPRVHLRISSNSHKKWIVGMPIKEDFSRWTISTVDPLGQFAALGVRPGWRVVAVNGARISNVNQEACRGILIRGEECQLTFVKPVESEQELEEQHTADPEGLLGKEGSGSIRARAMTEHTSLARKVKNSGVFRHVDREEEDDELREEPEIRAASPNTPSMFSWNPVPQPGPSTGLDRPPSTPVALHLGVKPASSPTSFTLDLPSSASDSKAHSGSKHSPHPEGGAPSEPRPVLQNAPQLMDDPPWLKAFAATTPGLTSDQGGRQRSTSMRWPSRRSNTRTLTSRAAPRQSL